MIRVETGCYHVTVENGVASMPPRPYPEAVVPKGEVVIECDGVYDCFVFSGGDVDPRKRAVELVEERF